MEERPDPIYQAPKDSPTQIRKYLLKDFTRDLRTFLRLSQDDETTWYESENLLDHLNYTKGYGKSKEFQDVFNHIAPIVDEYVEEFHSRETLTDEQFREYKESVVADLRSLIKILKSMDALAVGAKSMAAFNQIEKAPFASKGLSEDTAGVISSYLTGKRGTPAMQAEQLRKEVGKGGRKTKKNKSSKKKTHGRRV